MQPLGIVGDGADELLGRLVASIDGRVATIEGSESAARDSDGIESKSTDGTGLESTDGTGLESTATNPGAEAAYTLHADGSWSARGRGTSLSELLDELAPEYDFVLVAGVTGARIPTVVLGDGKPAVTDDHVVLTAESPDDVDLGALVERLDDFEPHVTLEELVQRAKASPRAERAGAIATFTGRVRAKDHPEDSRTEQLVFEKYDGVAERRLAEIEAELTERDGVYEVLLFHRVGVIDDGEDIVFVVVLAGHREEAFRTVEDGINRLKAEVPIFKKETTTDEEFWIHERE